MSHENAQIRMNSLIFSDLVSQMKRGRSSFFYSIIFNRLNYICAPSENSLPKCNQNENDPCKNKENECCTDLAGFFNETRCLKHKYCQIKIQGSNNGQSKLTSKKVQSTSGKRNLQITPMTPMVPMTPMTPTTPIP